MGRRGHEVSSFLGGGWSTVGLCHPVLRCDLLAAPLLAGCVLFASSSIFSLSADSATHVEGT